MAAGSVASAISRLPPPGPSARCRRAHKRVGVHPGEGRYRTLEPTAFVSCAADHDADCLRVSTLHWEFDRQSRPLSHRTYWTCLPRSVLVAVGFPARRGGPMRRGRPLRARIGRSPRQPSGEAVFSRRRRRVHSAARRFDSSVRARGGRCASERAVPRSRGGASLAISRGSSPVDRGSSRRNRWPSSLLTNLNDLAPDTLTPGPPCPRQLVPLRRQTGLATRSGATTSWHPRP